MGAESPAEERPRFNADFWEITLSDDAWSRIPCARGSDAADGDAPGDHPLWRDRAAALWPIVRDLMDECLSQRQREVVELYFMRGLNQRAIAHLLGITQQAVSEHLYGKLRHGATVGGAMRKMRKACARRGVHW